jgi:transposase-like protein
MAKKHPRAYPLEFRSKIGELARAGRRPEDLAAEFELSNQTIRNWIRQADLDTGKRTDGLTSAEKRRRRLPPQRARARARTLIYTSYTPQLKALKESQYSRTSVSAKRDPNRCIGKA